jgi:hypothetical protein
MPTDGGRHEEHDGLEQALAQEVAGAGRPSARKTAISLLRWIVRTVKNAPTTSAEIR